MSPQHYLTTYQGQSLLYNTADPSLRGQCVQAICFYVVGNHKPVIWADASNWFTSNLFSDQYERILYRSGSYPQPGDIVVWSPALPGSGGAGHIAVALSANRASFTSIDSNWGGKTVHTVTHTYAYVLGWMRFKVPAPAPAPAPQPEGDEMIATADQATKLYKMLRPNGGGTDAEIALTAGRRTFAEFVASAQNEVAARDANLRNQAALLNQAHGTVAQLQQTVAQLQQQDSTDQAAAKAAQAQLEQLTAQLEAGRNKLAEDEAKLHPPTPPAPPKPSPLVQLVSALLRIKPKQKA